MTRKFLTIYAEILGKEYAIDIDVDVVEAFAGSHDEPPHGRELDVIEFRGRIIERDDQHDLMWIYESNRDYIDDLIWGEINDD
jgi:hypothetical protein